MPAQEIFLDQQVGDRHVQIVKTYDSQQAREAFDQMPEEALRFLGRFLALDSKHDPADVPSPDDEDYADALWDEVQEGAREDWNSLSYFVVDEITDGRSFPVFVSADWPSASAFANRFLYPVTLAGGSDEIS